MNAKIFFTTLLLSTKIFAQAQTPAQPTTPVASQSPSVSPAPSQNPSTNSVPPQTPTSSPTQTVTPSPTSSPTPAPAQPQSTRLASFCVIKKDGTPSIINSLAADKKFPIASVSKLMTTWWLIKKKGPEYRFPTLLHITPLADGSADLHIEGSREPYFGLESIHYVLSEVQKLGFSQIKNLTFDENFKFIRSTTSRITAYSFYWNTDPKPEKVLENLTRLPILSGWNDSSTTLKSYGVVIDESPGIKIESIGIKKKRDFIPQFTTKIYQYLSSPSLKILKEMNRNSNNYAANQIFEHLGGPIAFKKDIAIHLNLTQEQMFFLNGSGDSSFYDGKKTYNEATCQSVVTIVRDLDLELEKKSLSLKNVAAVVGRDSESTAHRLYRSDISSESVIAKTGSVNPNITLAGYIETQKGGHYFMINAATKAGDWSTARQLIRAKLFEIINKLGGGEAINYKITYFNSLDVKSKLTDITPLPPLP